MRIFVPTQLVHLYGLVGYLLVKDVYGRYLLVSQISQVWLPPKEKRNGKRPRGMYYIRMSVLYTYTML